MASTSDFRNGMIIEFKNDLYELVYFQHVKPGKGGAFVRTKLKNLKNGSVIENTFRAGEKITEVRVERKTMEYLYNTENHYILMDKENYQQKEIPISFLGERAKYLIENTDVKAVIRGEEIIDIELPITVELKVKSCAPGVRGDTVTSGTKEAVMETGLKLQLPLFIEPGNVIKIDTRTGEYLERV